MVRNRYGFILILFCVLCFAKPHQAQETNWGVTATPSGGFFIPHHTSVNHLLHRHAYAFEVGASIQTDGSKQWHHDFLFPKIELLAFYGDFGNRAILGDAFGVEGSIYLPYFKKNGWSFGNILNAGLGVLTKKYDVDTNPKNNAIGSHLNYLATVGFAGEKQFKQQSIGVEIKMKHMSNGALQLPNLGVNMAYLGINYTHYLHPIHQINDSTSIQPRLNPPDGSWSVNTLIIGSAKEIYPTGGDLYGIIGLTNFVQYAHRTKAIFEGGIDLTYNGSIRHDAKVENKKNNLQIGGYFAYVLPVHHIQFLVGMGGYFYNPAHPSGPLYHKFGARVQLYKHLWANITIKSHWAKADYFEYGILYKW